MLHYEIQKASWGQSGWAIVEEMGWNRLQVVIVCPHLWTGFFIFYLRKFDV